MSHILVCSSSAHERPGDSLAAPAAAGQGVGTSDTYLQRNRQTVEVLMSMLSREAGGSREYFALMRAIVILEQA